MRAEAAKRPPEWTVTLVLLSMGLVPFYGGGALAVFLVAAIILAAWRVRGGSGPGEPMAWMPLAAVSLYLVYFWLTEMVHGGSVAPPSGILLQSAPLLVAALMIPVLRRAPALAPARVGHWARMSALVTALIGVAIGIFAPPSVLPVTAPVYVWGDTLRLEMFSKNPVIFSICLSFLVVLGFLAVRCGTARAGVTSVLAFGLSLGVIAVLSQSRGPTAVLVLAAIVLILVLRPKATAILALVAAALASVLAMVLVFDQFRPEMGDVVQYVTLGGAELFRTPQSSESSIDQRKLMYEAAFEAWRAAPLFGYGYDQQFAAIIPYLDLSLPVMYKDPHQALLNHMVAGGLVGLAIFLFVAFVPPIMLWISGDKRPEARFFAWTITLVLLGSGMTTSVMGHFVHATSLGTLWAVFAMMLRRPWDDAP